MSENDISDMSNGNSHVLNKRDGTCAKCWLPWPCPTVAALASLTEQLEGQ